MKLNIVQLFTLGCQKNNTLVQNALLQKTKPETGRTYLKHKFRYMWTHL